MIPLFFQKTFTVSILQVLIVSCSLFLPGGSVDLSTSQSYFRTSNYQINQPKSDYYSHQLLLKATEPGSFDPRPVRLENGVRYSIINNQKVFNPVVISQYGLWSLSMYHSTKDKRHLDHATKAANWLARNGKRLDGAIWFPYNYDFAAGNNPNLMFKAPWYSAMAQGQALSLFSRLYQTTKAQTYLDFANLIYHSFEVKMSQTNKLRYASHIDYHRNLWFEEFVGSAPPLSVVNGHGFAIFGLLDYYKINPNQNVKKLIDGGLTTYKQRFFDFYREAKPSTYCVNTQFCKSWASTKYHSIHALQLKYFAEITGDQSFKSMSETLTKAYLTKRPDGKVFIGW